jgi:hypothetical protein
MGEAGRLRRSGATQQADGIEETARAMRRTVDRELARARTAARARMHVPIRPKSPKA